MDAATWVSIRTLAVQRRNVEAAYLRLEAQIRRAGEDGVPAAMMLWADEQIPALRKVADQLTRQVVALARPTPIGQFVARTHGLGPAVLLLLGMLPPINEFDTVAGLWKYTGLHVVDGRSPKIRGGQSAGFSPLARSWAIIRIGDPCIRNRRSPYREVYDRRRERTAAEHPEWTLGHQHADARRVTAKAVLRDLWLVAHGKAAKYAQNDEPAAERKVA